MQMGVSITKKTSSGRRYRIWWR